MDQKFIHFIKDNTLIDANDILGVWMHDADKGWTTIDMKNGDDAYEIERIKFNEVISAIAGREALEGLIMEVP